jgi:hypothetical protein
MQAHAGLFGRMQAQKGAGRRMGRMQAHANVKPWSRLVTHDQAFPKGAPRAMDRAPRSIARPFAPRAMDRAPQKGRDP